MKSFETWYNKWLQNLDEKVPDELWDDIQDELDLQEVWHKLEDHYDGNPLPQPGRVIRKQLAISSLALLLILAMPFRLDRDKPGTTAAPARIISLFATDGKVQAETTAHHTTLNDFYAGPANEKENALADFHTEPNSKKESSLEEAVSYNNSQKEKAAVQGLVKPGQPGAQQQQAAAAARQDQMPGVYNNLPMIASLPLEQKTLVSPEFTSETLLSILAHRPVRDASQKERAVEAEEPGMKDDAEELAITYSAQAADSIKQKKLRLAYIGSMMGIKNTWLLNYETFNGLKSSTLSATLPTYRKEAGAVAAIQIKEKHRVATELFWRSEGGQKYREYINAAYVQRDIRLSYLKAQTYYILPNKFFPGELLAGGYIAYLNRGQEHFHAKVKDVSAQYTSFDYGLLTGYQANIRLLGNLFMLPSVRLNYNLNNIFSGNDELPAAYKRTRNAAVSLNAGLVYRY